MDLTVFFNLSYGVYVVSTWDREKVRPTGCIANSLMQVTAEPSTLAVSINHDNYTNKLIRDNGAFAVSILTEKTDPKLIGTFGFRSGRDTEKFQGAPYEIRDEQPILTESCGYLICRVIDQMEAPTHTVFLAEVVAGENLKKEPPMTYEYYHKVVKGKAPKTAPTYVPPASKKESRALWKCSVCGYIYEGEVPFEELPEDYKCPICGQPKSAFQKA